MITVKMTNKAGVILDTAGKFCEKLISVELSDELLAELEGSGITEVETAEEMDAILSEATEEDIGSIYKFVGESTSDYENGTLYIIEKANILVVSLSNPTDRFPSGNTISWEAIDGATGYSIEF